MALQQLDGSQFLELVSALVGLFAAALGGLALAGVAFWKVRRADRRAALALGLAGIAQTLALLVAGVFAYVRPIGELAKYGAEESVFTWLMLLPAAQVAIVLSLALLPIDGLVAFAAVSLSGRRTPYSSESLPMGGGGEALSGRGRSTPSSPA